MRFFLLSVLLSLFLQTTFAQQTFEEKMKWYALAKPTSNLFVHFDKNVYSNNETAYFTGYLIKAARTPTHLHKVMSIALIRDVDSALIIEDKFIMNKGLSFGSLTLPDSIPTGNYHFLVYTDKLMNDLPEALFIQNILIKSSIEPPFNAAVKLIDQAKAENKAITALVSARAVDGRFLKKPSQITYAYGKIKKSVFTDASGQYLITLPAQTNVSDPNLYVKLKNERDSSFINIAIPQHKQKALVKFYPEGGNLVNGLDANIGWEVKDQQNRPMALKAFLFKNQLVIDTIETSSYGIGNFMLKPELGVNYTVKLIHSNLVDTIYQLPIINEKGLSIRLEKAIVTDTLKINLSSTEKSKINILVHNFKTCFINTPINTRVGNTLVKIPLEDMPKGLTTLTLIDSLNRPLAERLFFAHYSESEKLSITSDKEIYAQRQKVSLKLTLNQDENAVVSVAAVQNNRLHYSRTNDIESNTYLSNFLSSLPLVINGSAYKNRNYMEQILLVKGWRKYTWQELDLSKPTDTLLKFDSLKIGGQASRAKKELSNPLVIGTLGGQSVSLISTNANGSFKLQEDQLITPASKKMYAFINGVDKLPFPVKLEINDQFEHFNQKMAKTLPNPIQILPSDLVNNSELLLKSNEKAIRLKEVIITKKNDDGFSYMSGANACGDYVCIYNILNCRNHVGEASNKQPKKGFAYLDGNTKQYSVYAGCTVPDQGIFKLVKGIHLEKEFYIDDYKDPKEPAFFSTIYWNYGTLLNAKKVAEISFYTTDITGKFRIVVQGVTDKDVVYAEHFFEVKEKQKL